MSYGFIGGTSVVLALADLLGVSLEWWEFNCFNSHWDLRINK